MKSLAYWFISMIVSMVIFALIPIDTVTEQTDPNPLYKIARTYKNVFYVLTKKYNLYSGGKYYGEMTSIWFGLPHGEGMWRFKKADSGESITYKGQWQYGEFHGQGTLESSNGFEYVGEFKDGDFDGKGSHTTKDGDRYVGEFENDEYNGRFNF